MEITPKKGSGVQRGQGSAAPTPGSVRMGGVWREDSLASRNRRPSMLAGQNRRKSSFLSPNEPRVNKKGRIMENSPLRRPARLFRLEPDIAAAGRTSPGNRPAPNTTGEETPAIPRRTSNADSPFSPAVGNAGSRHFSSFAKISAAELTRRFEEWMQIAADNVSDIWLS